MKLKKGVIDYNKKVGKPVQNKVKNLTSSMEGNDDFAKFMTKKKDRYAIDPEDSID